MEFDVEWAFIGWVGGVAYTGIKYLNIEASNLKNDLECTQQPK